MKNFIVIIMVMGFCCVCSAATDINIPNPSFEYPEVPDGSDYVELYGTSSDWTMYSDYGGLDRIYEDRSFGAIDGDQVMYIKY
jgi:hypothetical protein